MPQKTLKPQKFKATWYVRSPGMEVLQPSAQKPVGAGGRELTPCLLEAFQM